MEDRYEVIEIIVRTPSEEPSWFDKIFDLITETCDGVSDQGPCSCGLESMGGSGGTLDQCYDYTRISEKWAIDVQAADLKRILSIAADHLEEDDKEPFKRLKKAAYWHEEIDEWLATRQDDDEQ